MGRKLYPQSSLSSGSLDSKTTLTATTATTYLDLTAAAVFKVNLAANTSIYFQNAPVTNGLFSFTVMTINDATANRTLAFVGTGAPKSVQWAGGLTPPRTTAANAVDTYTFFTEDGVTFVGSLAIADSK